MEHKKRTVIREWNGEVKKKVRWEADVISEVKKEGGKGGRKKGRAATGIRIVFNVPS